jgi:teichuronic acid biosynthesis glycosyltransferase TuaC
MRVLVASNMFPSDAEPWYGCFVKEQAEDVRAHGIDVQVLHFDGRGDARKYAHAAVRIRQIVNEGSVEVVHAHYGLTGAVALLQRRVPVVTTFWGSDTGYVPWQAVVSRHVARHSTPIFVAARNAHRLGFKQATVIPSAVDTDLFRPMSQAKARSLLGWDPEQPVMLLAGSMSRRVKRPDLFLAVAGVARTAIPNIRTESLEQLSRAEVAVVMNAADVTVLTSDAEGSPVAVKESLACQTPVVSVPVGDVEDVLGGLPGCSVRTRDPKDLARGVAEALSVGKPVELRARAEEFSRLSIAARIIGVYEQVAERG